MIDLDLKLVPSTDWRTMPPDERKRALFQKQKDLLDAFLSRGAIDRRQYEKSLTCMAEKMGMPVEFRWSKQNVPRILWRTSN